MKEKIDKLLSQKAPLKARDVSRELEFDRTEVNSFLHNHPEHYQQDEEYRWSTVKGQELVLTLPGGWINAGTFEDILRVTGSVLDGSHRAIRIVFSPKCKVMIDCTARLLALINQLAAPWQNSDRRFHRCRSTARAYSPCRTLVGYSAYYPALNLIKYCMDETARRVAPSQQSMPMLLNGPGIPGDSIS